MSWGIEWSSLVVERAIRILTNSVNLVERAIRIQCKSRLLVVHLYIYPYEAYEKIHLIEYLLTSSSASISAFHWIDPLFPFACERFSNSFHIKFCCIVVPTSCQLNVHLGLFDHPLSINACEGSGFLIKSSFGIYLPLLSWVCRPELMAHIYNIPLTFAHFL